MKEKKKKIIALKRPTETWNKGQKPAKRIYEGMSKKDTDKLRSIKGMKTAKLSKGSKAKRILSKLGAPGKAAAVAWTAYDLAKWGYDAVTKKPSCKSGEFMNKKGKCVPRSNPKSKTTLIERQMEGMGMKKKKA